MELVNDHVEDCVNRGKIERGGKSFRRLERCPMKCQFGVCGDKAMKCTQRNSNLETAENIKVMIACLMGLRAIPYANYDEPTLN